MENIAAKLRWIRKNGRFVEISNNRPGCYLIISVGIWNTGGQGRVFLESQIDQCIEFIKKENEKRLTKGLRSFDRD